MVFTWPRVCEFFSCSEECDAECITSARLIRILNNKYSTSFTASSPLEIWSTWDRQSPSYWGRFPESIWYTLPVIRWVYMRGIVTNNKSSVNPRVTASRRKMIVGILRNTVIHNPLEKQHPMTNRIYRHHAWVYPGWSFAFAQTSIPEFLVSSCAMIELCTKETVVNDRVRILPCNIGGA